MTYEEKEIKLKNLSDEYAVAICCSVDCFMESEIEVPLRVKHPQFRVSCLDFVRKNDALGDIYMHRDRKGFVVYAMFVKEHGYDNAEDMPEGEYEKNLRSCLEHIKYDFMFSDKKILAMPYIGHNDRFKWSKAKALIEDIFGNTDTSILICGECPQE